MENCTHHGTYYMISVKGDLRTYCVECGHDVVVSYKYIPKKLLAHLEKYFQEMRPQIECPVKYPECRVVVQYSTLQSFLRSTLD